MKQKYLDEKYSKQIEKYNSQILQFGENIKGLRQKRKMTQLELASESKIGLRTIQRIENGQITVKFTIILVLAETFDVPAQSLLKGI